MTNFTHFEFYPYRKPTDEHTNAVEKVFTSEIADQLIKLGVVRITIGSSEDFISKIKNEKSLLGLTRIITMIDPKDLSKKVKEIKNIVENVKNSFETP